MEQCLGNVESSLEKPDGERWLELLGFSQLKGQPTGYQIDGVPVDAENFYLLCEEHARPIFMAIESLSPEDPRYDKFIAAAKEAFISYFPPAELNT